MNPYISFIMKYITMAAILGITILSIKVRRDNRLPKKDKNNQQKPPPKKLPQLPDYVFTKRFDYFIFFHDNILLEGRKTDFKDSFHAFLNDVSNNELVYMQNSCSDKKTEVDFKYYDDLYRKYSGNIPKEVTITESPDMLINSEHWDWEYYSNTLFNVSILGYNNNLISEVEKHFGHLIKRPDLCYENIMDYLKWNDFIFNNSETFNARLLKNYSNRMYLLNEIKKIVMEKAKIINLDEKFLPLFDTTHAYDNYIVDFKDGYYHYYYSGRGKNSDLQITQNYEELLYWIFKHATFRMAFDYELKNRVEGQDSRKIAFIEHKKILERLGIKQRYIIDLITKYNSFRERLFEVVEENNSKEEKDKGVIVNINKGIDTGSKLFFYLSDKLKFPDYYGHNWDALYDCLRDLHWLSEKSVTLIHEEGFTLSNENELDIYKKLLEDTVKSWEKYKEFMFEVIWL